METTQLPRSTFIRADDEARIEVTTHSNDLGTLINHFTAYLMASGFPKADITKALAHYVSLLKEQQGAVKPSTRAGAK